MSEEFLSAAETGDLAAVKAMLAEERALANAHDKWGFTALHLVVSGHGPLTEDDEAIVALLIEGGADVAAKNDMRLTPLHLTPYPELVVLLVKHGADVSARGANGATPLHIMAEDQDGYDAMKALLERGADANARDDAGSTAMDIARSREEANKVELLQAFGGR